jgi:rusticyanin
MKVRTAAAIGAILLALGILGLALGGSIGAAGGLSSGGQPGYAQGQGFSGMMGGGSASGGFGGMMGDYGASGGAGLINNARLGSLVRQGELGATIDQKANTVTYSGSTVTLVALASPHGKPNMTWEIDGLVNPTVVVRPGAHVTVDLVNTDWGYMHGFELTQTPPPYSFMVMMDISSNFSLMPLPERTTKDLSTAQFYNSTWSFTVTSGTYYYLCQFPGHAEQGMYGKLVVG